MESLINEKVVLLIPYKKNDASAKQKLQVTQLTKSIQVCSPSSILFVSLGENIQGKSLHMQMIIRPQFQWLLIL